MDALIQRRFFKLIEPVLFALVVAIFAVLWLLKSDFRNQLRGFKTGRSILLLLRLTSKRSIDSMWPFIVLMLGAPIAGAASGLFSASEAVAVFGTLFAISAVIPLLFSAPALGELRRAGF